MDVPSFSVHIQGNERGIRLGVQRREAAAKALVNHLQRMRASHLTIPIEVDGETYEVSAGQIDDKLVQTAEEILIAANKVHVTATAEGLSKEVAAYFREIAAAIERGAQVGRSNQGAGFSGHFNVDLIR